VRLDVPILRAVRAPNLSPRRRAIAAADPLVHALLAAAVTAPVASKHGRGPVITAVVAGTLIDVDHPVAARSVRLGPMVSMATRPRSHSLLSAVGVGAVAVALGGPVHGWAAFAGLSSHLLHDAGDIGAPTPLLWPWAPARQLGRRLALAGTAVLALGSLAVSRAAARDGDPAAAGAGGAAGGAPRRTA
jgi:LexA-binding, inner membrane-associated putative hydrolase